MTWTLSESALSPTVFTNRLTGERLSFVQRDLFRVELDGAPDAEPMMRRASDMRLRGRPSLVHEPGCPEVGPLASVHPGQCISAVFEDAACALHVIWTAELRDHANTVRISLRVEPDSWEVVTALTLVDCTMTRARVAGSIDGVPVVGESVFAGVEHPRSANVAGRPEDEERCTVTCGLRFLGLVRRSDAATASAVLGAAPEGQLRRAFLYYLEREAPRPYRPYLHYNNGYEIGVEYWRRMKDDAGEALAFRLEEERLYGDLIDRIGGALVTKRGVQLDGVVHDFMWDDENQVWRFHEGYPDGFDRVAERAARYGAGVGVWFGPWGGYAGRKARVAGGEKQGFLISRNGLSLTCPNYRGRFLSAARGMIREENVNYLKIDGFAKGNSMGGAAEYASEADALIEIIDMLRELNPDVVVNPSTGSWPSPFWLLHADVIWRQGSDSGVVRAGSPRQRWITYRDAQTYEHVVKASPLYPLNSLMLHGIYMNSSRFAGNPEDPEGSVQNFDLEDVTAEVRTFFGSGTSLQELYVDPRLMDDALWDVLAEAAKWARANAPVLVDTHWIGGDPAALDLYGWASWSASKGIVVMRNPGDVPQTWALDPAAALEIPVGADGDMVLSDVWHSRPEFDGRVIAGGDVLRIDLAPFEVLVLETRPAAG